MKDWYAHTDDAIAKTLGERLEQLRLEANITQASIAKELGITPVTYRNAIAGKGSFTTIIGILRVLGQLERVDQFIPEESFSPLALLEMKGKERSRARAKEDTGKDDAQDTSTW